MTDIAAIEARLKAALDRIAASAEKLGPAAAESGGEGDTAQLAAALAEAEAERDTAREELSRVQASLEAETAAHAQLSERVQALRAKQEQMAEQLETRVERLLDRVNGQENEIARLRQVNATLRQNAKALRQAAARGLSDPGLVNASLEAELDATRAMQETDRAELDAILSELTPLIEEKADV